MKKLVDGIVDFRKNVLAGYREKFAKLALGQSPDALFIACSDSRVVPNLFASTDPGDLFVIRNVANLIPRCGSEGLSTADESEAAAIEFALTILNVRDIIICGHSECGGMNALLNGRENVSAKNLKSWLRHAEPALERMQKSTSHLSPVNQLSQANALTQIENVMTYPVVSERVKQGKLGLHVWWFELSTADVYAYDFAESRYLLLDEKAAEMLVKKNE